MEGLTAIDIVSINFKLIGAIISVAGTIVLGLLSVIAYFVRQQVIKLGAYNDMVNEMNITNAVSHAKIEKKVESVTDWTAGVYKETIKPTSLIVNKNRTDIGVVKEQIKNHDMRISKLEDNV